MAIDSNMPAKGTPHHADNWLPSKSAAKARPGTKHKKPVRAKCSRAFTNISFGLNSSGNKASARLQLRTREGVQDHGRGRAARMGSGKREDKDSVMAGLSAKEVDFKQQGGIGWNHAASAACAIAQLSWNHQATRATDGHALHAFVPTLDHLTGTQ